MMDEPHITINNILLTPAQAMIVRVAVSSLLLELQDEDYVKDLGPIGPLYRERLGEIAHLLARTTP